MLILARRQEESVVITTPAGEEIKILIIDAYHGFETKPMPGGPRWRIGGQDHDISAEGGLWYLISLAGLDKQEEKKVKAAVMRCFMWQEPSDAITVSEWVLSLTNNKTIYNIFQNQSAQFFGIFGREFFQFGPLT